MTLAVWIVAIAGALAWLLPLAGSPIPLPPQAVLALAPPPAAAGAAERLLGTPPVAEIAAAAPTPEESRYKLLGVIAPRHAGGSGLALISVDGQAPRAVAVGREVEPGTRVIAVSHRRVDLGAGTGAPTTTLELPAIPEPSRGRPGDVQPAAMPGPAPATPLMPGRPRAGGLAGGMRLPIAPTAPLAVPGAQPPAAAEQGVEPMPVPNDGRSLQ